MAEAADILLTLLIGVAAVAAVIGYVLDLMLPREMRTTSVHGAARLVLWGVAAVDIAACVAWFWAWQTGHPGVPVLAVIAVVTLCNAATGWVIYLVHSGLWSGQL